MAPPKKLPSLRLTERLLLSLTPADRERVDCLARRVNVAPTVVARSCLLTGLELHELQEQEKELAPAAYPALSPY